MKIQKKFFSLSLLFIYGIVLFVPFRAQAAGCVIWYEQRKVDAITGNFSYELTTPPACMENIPGKELNSENCRVYTGDLYDRLYAQNLRVNASMFVPDLSCQEITQKTKNEILNTYKWENETPFFTSYDNTDSKTGCYCKLDNNTALGERFFPQFSADESACPASATVDFSFQQLGVHCQWQVKEKPQQNVTLNTTEKLEAVALPPTNELNQFGGQTLQQVIGNIIKTAMGIMGTIALVVLVSAGVMWMTTGGNSTREEQAKDMMLWGALGVVIILSSYIIVQFVFEAFSF